MGRNITVAIVVVGLVGAFMGGVWMADNGSATPPKEVIAESTDDGTLVAECLINQSNEFIRKYEDGYEPGWKWGPDDTAAFGSLAASYAEIMCADRPE